LGPGTGNRPKESSPGVGGMNNSEPEAEFQETVNKSKAMLKAVALAETIAEAS